MNNPMVISIFTALSFGGLAGLFTLQSNNEIHKSEINLWEAFEAESNLESISWKLESILASGLIYKSRTIDIRAPEIVDPDEGVPEFPTIRSFSIVDSVPQVHLFSIDAVSFTAKEGDVLPSGWVLKSLSNDLVVATFDGEERTFDIATYGSVEDDGENKP